VKKTLLLWSLAFCMIFWTMPAAAQLKMLISPIRVEYQVPAGGSETNVIQVRNEGTTPARLKVYVEDWTMDRKGTITYSRPGTNPNSCAAWVQVNPTDFRLAPGTREVRYTLTIPPGAKPGSYWSAILFEAMPVQEVKPVGKKMGVHPRIGVVVYETLGSPAIKVNFQDFKMATKTKEPVFILTLANDGAAYSRLKKSFITVKNSQGIEAARLEVPDIPLLPGTTREVEIKLNKALPKGEYLAQAVLDVGRRDFLGRKLNFAVGGK
jgi:P pilus assembly chaperone PapD